jgi:1-acyl-sn-glycerol-3-phosphate acyltransferase
MLSFLPKPLIIVLSLSLYAINTIFWLIPIVIFSFLKAVLPFVWWRRLMNILLDQMASNWISVNTFNQQLFTHVNITHTGTESLSINDWVLVIANHQSWVDILVLQRLLHGKVPFLKFFLKQELIYVPFLGIAWWALDFPFMKRYSKDFLAKHPELKGKDIETTRKACEKFRYKPVAIMNFLEGTRFTPAKHQHQQSPFRYLLKPKAGGIAFVLNAMGDQLTKIVDVTIFYPDGIPSYIDFVSGKVKRIHVAVKTYDIEPFMIGDYMNDAAFKEKFQHWVNQIWLAKDQQLAEMAAAISSTENTTQEAHEQLN